MPSVTSRLQLIRHFSSGRNTILHPRLKYWLFFRRCPSAWLRSPPPLCYTSKITHRLQYNCHISNEQIAMRQEKLKKLARSQLPDSDCDYDEVSSCYYCWLCQIFAISTVAAPCTRPASFINRERPLPKYLRAPPTDLPALYYHSKYRAEGLLCLHEVFLLLNWF